KCHTRRCAAASLRRWCVRFQVPWILAPGFRAAHTMSAERGVRRALDPRWTHLHPAGPMIDYRRLRTDLLALGLLATIVFVGLSLSSYDPADPPSTLVYPANPQVTNICGPVGARLAYGLHAGLGYGAYALLAAMLLFDLRLFSRKGLSDPL